jgi:two-component system OmpR family sensor kinase
MTLYNKIRIIFFVATLLLTAFFTSYLYIQKGYYLQKNEKRYMQTTLFILKHFRQSQRNHEILNFNDENLLFFLQESNFKPIIESHIQQIHSHSRLLRNRPLFRINTQVWRHKQNFYLFIKHPQFQLLLEDKEKASFPQEILLAYILSLFFLLSLYFWLTRSLKPLKSLHESIQKVAKGDLSISFQSKKSDEIAQVSNAFDDALRKIEALINSRQLFLRTIMHELKTPIGKGKLLNEFLEDQKQRDSYEMVFERLELLIEEFSKIEQMFSSSYQLKLVSYNVQEMINQALELMIMDEEEIEKQVKIYQLEAFILKTDFELFSLALKNLIDNALKYSSDHKIKIFIHQNKIELSNRGEQFTQNLKEYTQPFNPKGQGLGLGLYIVQNIMKLLKLTIYYEYVEGENRFVITPSND